MQNEMFSSIDIPNETRCVEADFLTVEEVETRDSALVMDVMEAVSELFEAGYPRMRAITSKGI